LVTERRVKGSEFKFYNPQSLEWEKVCEYIASFANSERVKEKLKKLRPDCEPPEEKFKYLYDIRELNLDEIPAGGMEDIEELVERAEKGGILKGKELLSIASFIRSFLSIKDYIRSKKEIMKNFFELLKEIEIPLEIMREVYRCIDPTGNIYDTVDEELMKLRKRVLFLKEMIEKVHKRMMEENPRFFQDDYITLRNERFVFPIKVEEKGWVDGIIHGRSSTGETYFIEPVELVPINNEIRTCEEKIEEIQSRFFAELSALVGEFGVTLKKMIVFSDLLEETVAKARFMKAVSGSIPEIKGEGISLIGLRHPLLIMQGVNVVPNDVEIYPARCMVLSGPNAGGKTVLAKAVGIAVALAYSGVPVPAESSRIGRFKGIFVETGDPQNLYFGLSTFSGHIKNLKEIYEQSEEPSLIILDEAFSGTNPGEASALLISYAEELIEKGNYVLLTTHSPEVMAWGEEREDAFNYGMGWDPERFTPTYIGKKGMIGISASFHLAERLEFPRSIIEKAKRRAGKSAELQLLYQRLEKELSEVEKMKSLLVEREKKLEMRELEVERKMDSELRKMRASLREEARKTREILKSILESAKKETSVEKIKSYIKKVEKISEEYGEKHTPLSAPPSKGDVVYIPFLKKKGTVLSYNEKKEIAEVEIEGKKIFVPFSLLAKGIEG
jgi:DNA mismatch repair protein MutS2